MKTRATGTLIKFTIFGVVMAVLTVFLFVIFGQVRTGPTNGYSAVFADASRLETGDTVRVAGLRVGTVQAVSLRPDRTVLVKFDADRSIRLTTGTKVAIRYLNLVGDRYLELVDTPGSTMLLPPGSEIPESRTAPALDLDLLLGGLKPVIQGLNPNDVNALSASLIQILQGQGGTLDSLFSKASSFTNSLADNNQVIEQLIEDLKTTLATLSKDGDDFSGAIDKLEQLIQGLSDDRDPIGTAIEQLDAGTANVADLLSQARPPLAGTVDKLNSLATNLDNDKDRLNDSIGRLPNIYRKLARVGSYGAFFPYYICGIAFRASDLQGRTVQFPWIKQETGRCAETS
ncbi:MCE family protein [Mycobacterium sp. OAE908]|uniref:MCE family protein n=1 Tax=Mycobacterium sp. OAE908 TaxID=2817899 RepID=UPI001AE307FE